MKPIVSDSPILSFHQDPSQESWQGEHSEAIHSSQVSGSSGLRWEYRPDADTIQSRDYDENRRDTLEQESNTVILASRESEIESLGTVEKLFGYEPKPAENVAKDI